MRFKWRGVNESRKPGMRKVSEEWKGNEQIIFTDVFYDSYDNWSEEIEKQWTYDDIVDISCNLEFNVWPRIRCICGEEVGIYNSRWFRWRTVDYVAEMECVKCGHHYVINQKGNILEG